MNGDNPIGSRGSHHGLTTGGGMCRPGALIWKFSVLIIIPSPLYSQNVLLKDLRSDLLEAACVVSWNLEDGS